MSDNLKSFCQYFQRSDTLNYIKKNYLPLANEIVDIKSCIRAYMAYQFEDFSFNYGIVFTVHEKAQIVDRVYKLVIK